MLASASAVGLGFVPDISLKLADNLPRPRPWASVRAVKEDRRAVAGQALISTGMYWVEHEHYSRRLALLLGCRMRNRRARHTSSTRFWDSPLLCTGPNTRARCCMVYIFSKGVQSASVREAGPSLSAYPVALAATEYAETIA